MMTGWLPSVLLLFFAALIAAGLGYEVRLLVRYPAAFSRCHLAAGWLVVALAAAAALGLASLAGLCAGR